MEIVDHRQNPAAEFAYVEISSINRQFKKIGTVKWLKGEVAPSRARQRILRGDVLVSTTRPNLNAVSLVDEDFDGQVCSTGFCVLRPMQFVLPEFLFLFVQSPGFVAELEARATGSSYPAVSNKVVKDVMMPVPPAIDQARIALGAEERMAYLYSALGAIHRSRETMVALTNAFLRELVPVGRNSLPRDWRWARIEDVCRIDRQSIDPGTAEADSLPYLSLENIESGTGRIMAAKDELLGLEAKSRTYRFDQRHVLYGKMRPNLNKVALPAFAGASTTTIEPMIPLGISRDWLAASLRHPRTVAFATENATGSRTPVISMEKLSSLEIAIPPKDEETRIVRELTRLYSHIRALRATILPAEKAVGQLRNAIIVEALSGRW